MTSDLSRKACCYSVRTRQKKPKCGQTCLILDIVGSVASGRGIEWQVLFERIWN